jgi:glycosyltransferase involved in cell wall biosynthesis
MMKILFVAPSAYLLGGVQDWLYMLTLGLRQKGYEIQVAIPNDYYHNGIKYNDYYANIKAVFFSNLTGTSLGRINALSHLLVKTNANIIVGVNIGDIYKAYIKSYPQLSKTKIVMTLHAIEADYLGDIGKYSSILDAVITTNRLTQRIVQNLQLIESERIMYSPYGVEGILHKAYSNTADHLRIAWVGRFTHQQKRILDLCNILQCLDKYEVPYTLSLAGDGPIKNKLRHDLSKWIKNGKARFVGLLNKNQLEYFYTQNDILLITSEWETGPIVAWEAMLSGLVVVSSQFIGIASEKALVNDQTALLFPVGSAQLAAQQISRLLDPQLYQRIASSGKSMAASRYSLDASVTSWETAFLKIMEGQAKRKKTFKLPIFETGGKVENLIGSQANEIIRSLIGRKGFCRDPGSEWPHSTYCHTNPESLFEYAKLLEQVS